MSISKKILLTVCLLLCCSLSLTLLWESFVYTSLLLIWWLDRLDFRHSLGSSLVPSWKETAWLVSSWSSLWHKFKIQFVHHYKMLIKHQKYVVFCLFITFICTDNLSCMIWAGNNLIGENWQQQTHMSSCLFRGWAQAQFLNSSCLLSLVDRWKDVNISHKLKIC